MRYELKDGDVVAVRLAPQDRREQAAEIPFVTFELAAGRHGQEPSHFGVGSRVLIRDQDKITVGTYRVNRTIVDGDDVVVHVSRLPDERPYDGV